MRYVLTFIISLVLGVVLFFGAVMGISHSMVGEGSLPETEELLFEGLEIDANGWEWHLPLIGGKVDKKMTSAQDLTVQKLGNVSTVQPRFSLPKWVNYGVISVENEAGSTVFEGTIAEYEAFSYPANGEYKVAASFWHLPHDSRAEERIEVFEQSGIVGSFCWNAGVETPAQPTGYYSYRFRFNLNATAILTLSAESASVGSVVALQIDGILGDNVPTIVTDLGDVTALPYHGGYRAYLPITYNTPSGAHDVTVTVGDKTFETAVNVKAISHDTIHLEKAEKEGTADESAEFRSAIWSLYTADATEKAWARTWTCPVANYDVTVDYSDIKYYDDTYLGYSNCIVFAVGDETPVFAPAAGTVVYVGKLGLTGNTIVIDHGHGVRTYLYELGSIDVARGDEVAQGQTIAATAESVTLDIKIGNKSISPWQLFRTQGGMFWQE